MHILNLTKNIKLALNSYVGLISTFTILGLIDIYSDFVNESFSIHTSIEILAILTSIVIGLIAFQINFKKTQVDLKNIINDFNKLKNLNTILSEGLAIKIKCQFTNWHLTNAESEVGFLLLKGFSQKEISTLRKTSESTIKDQSKKIYFKAGVKNRSELSAFFLEDLLYGYSEINY